MHNVTFLGYPVFGFWLPFIGFRTKELPENILDVDFCVVQEDDDTPTKEFNTFSVEWLGLGCTLWAKPVY